MKRIAVMIVVSALVFLSAVLPVFAGGISSRFVEEKLGNLQPGKSYSVKEILKKPLAIDNTTKDITVGLEIVPEKPVDYNLVPGYEAIPDLSWVRIEKSRFEAVGPGLSAETDIIITIPNRREYSGKKYQVYIYSRTSGQTTFRVGLMSRILFSTASSTQ